MLVVHRIERDHPAHVRGRDPQEVGDLGGTSPDGKWTVIEVECLGACGFATPILVNDDFIESVTPEQVPEIVRKYS